MYSEIINN